MKKLFLSILCAVVTMLTSLPSSANAEKFKEKTGDTSDKGFYISGSVGVGIMDDFKLTPERRMKFEDAFAGSLSLGHETLLGFRSEIALSYQKNDSDGVSGLPGKPGKAETWALMGNAMYDIENSSPATPYIGVGVGGVKVDLDNYDALLNPNKDSTTFPAAQAIVGIGFKVSDKARLFFDYKYIRDINGINTSVRLADGSKENFEYKNNVVMAGVRYSF